MSEWNKLIANALMGYAKDDPSTGNVRNSLMDMVTNRATFFPAADYADGSTRWAWPGMFHEPASAWNKMLQGDASLRNAMTVAGTAMAGGMPFAQRNTLGSSGGLLRLFHGTSADSAAQIERDGYIRGPAFFSPRREVANGYGETVIEAMIPKDRLKIDFDLPGARLLAVDEANGYAERHGWTIDDWIRFGQSVGIDADTPVK